MVGIGGRPVPHDRFSIRSMIPATNAAALDAMPASPAGGTGNKRYVRRVPKDRRAMEF
jgi:hypothetical protein